MNQKIVLVSLIAVLAVVFAINFAASASVYPWCIGDNSTICVQEISINGIKVGEFGFGLENTVSLVAGDTVPVTIYFTANDNAEDVQVSAYIKGYSEDKIVQDFDDLISGNDYIARLSLKVPADLDEIDLGKTLKLAIESDAGDWDQEFGISLQRETYGLDITFAEMDRKVNAGETLNIDVVATNIGRHELEDVVAKAEIPTLGISKSIYLKDLSPTDEDECDDNEDDNNNNDNCIEGVDSRSGTIKLVIPADVPAGNYQVKLTAYNEDAETSVTKEIVVVGAEAETQIIASPISKTFATGEKAEYRIILVNSGKDVKIYSIVPEMNPDLAVTIDEPVVAVPSGSTKTVLVSVTSAKEGTFAFKVNVISRDKLAESILLSAVVEGKSGQLKTEPIVIWTIVLAVVFVVLLIILIVLLTRKPERTEELGESYY